MVDEIEDAMIRALDEAESGHVTPDDIWAKLRETGSYKVARRRTLAVARVALERAAEHLRAEAKARMAGLKTTEDRDTSHLVIGLLRSMADDIEGLVPAEKEPDVATPFTP